MQCVRLTPACMSTVDTCMSMGVLSFLLTPPLPPPPPTHTYTRTHPFCSLLRRCLAPCCSFSRVNTHSQAAVVEVPLVTVGGPLPPNLRALLLVGDFFLGGVISVSLTKLLLRLRALGAAAPHTNKAGAQAMLAIVSIMRLGESTLLPTPLDGESLL